MRDRPVDVVCGGFPCQDISVAGKGVGIEGERSGLWSEYARLIGELRPQFVIVENVVPKASYNRLMRSYRRLVELVSARDGAEAEAHWRRHMENSSAALSKGHEKTMVRDVMD